MRPDNLEFYGDDNGIANLTFVPSQLWSGFTALTRNGREFGQQIMLRGLLSREVGLDACKFMEPAGTDLVPGYYKRAEVAGEATLHLIVVDPSEPLGHRIEPVLNDYVIELSPQAHEEQAVTQSQVA